MIGSADFYSQICDAWEQTLSLVAQLAIRGNPLADVPFMPAMGLAPSYSLGRPGSGPYRYDFCTNCAFARSVGRRIHCVIVTAV